VVITPAPPITTSKFSDLPAYCDAAAGTSMTSRQHSEPGCRMSCCRCRDRMRRPTLLADLRQVGNSVSALADQSVTRILNVRNQAQIRLGFSFAYIPFPGRQLAGTEPPPRRSRSGRVRNIPGAGSPELPIRLYGGETCFAHDAGASRRCSCSRSARRIIGFMAPAPLHHRAQGRSCMRRRNGLLPQSHLGCAGARGASAAPRLAFGSAPQAK